MLKYCKIVSAITIFVTYCGCVSVSTKDEEPRTSFILSEPNELVSYDQAARICKAFGNMKPVSILTREKNLEVVVFLASYDIKNVWTSGNDLEIRSYYVWTGINKPFVYTNWLIGAPLHDESCRCVSMAQGTTGACPGNATKCAGWTVEPCKEKRRVLCEVE